jgi:polysaccharide export outer membrane protein
MKIVDFYPFILCVLIFSCTSKKENIMFRLPEDFTNDTLLFDSGDLKNYVVKPEDYLNVRLYSNGGEIILDPNNWLSSSISNSSQSLQQIEKPRYLVDPNGSVELPLVGKAHVEGYTIKQVDSVLAVAYSEFYVGPFLVTTLANRRVIVIGPEGGVVIPLDNENMNLIEVIALYGGMDKDSKAHNIRLIRGDLRNPAVQLVDLSTIEGLKNAQLQVQPNDIVYIEQVRKPFIESAQEYAPVIGILTSLFSLTALIISLQK